MFHPFTHSMQNWFFVMEQFLFCIMLEFLFMIILRNTVLSSVHFNEALLLLHNNNNNIVQKLKWEIFVFLKKKKLYMLN